MGRRIGQPRLRARLRSYVRISSSGSLAMLAAILRAS